MSTDTDAIRKALRRAFSLGQTYWQQADSESYKQNRLSDDTIAKFDELVEATIAAYDAQQAAPKGWQPIKDAPRDGTIILGVLPGVDYPHSIYFGNRKRDNGYGARCWRVAWDRSVIADHDEPMLWMPCQPLPGDPS